ncbi:unnamed protein product [Timema podura]|uniref:THD domain-containing protein n=1 Tax=Timema podura TaxID=61482 RepID=A0ABN7NLA8_TIMPD|nr:unnamed protein product [Timema podura]
MILYVHRYCPDSAGSTSTSQTPRGGGCHWHPETTDPGCNGTCTCGRPGSCPQESYTQQNPHLIVNTVWSSKPSLKKYSPPTDIPLLTRQSRVMQTDSSSSGVPLIVPYIPSGQHETKYQEQKASPVTVVHSGGKNRQRRLKTERINPALETLDEQTTSRPTRTRQLVVAHYHGDTSRYSTDHPYYDGNGRLRHPDGIFTDWVASSWMNQLGMNRHFTLQQGGTVTIRTSGVYYIYAQIYYVDEHDTNGYRVYVNNIPVLQCTTSTSHVPNTSQSNTCHSTTLHYLNQSDQLSIRDVEGLRYSLFEPAKSFFGLIKMGDATIK